jgi:hypothetical protein
MHFVAAIDSIKCKADAEGDSSAGRPLRAVLGLHETVCAGAADGYARMARRPALTLLHLGPGLANALANLHNARRAGTPVVNLVGASLLLGGCLPVQAALQPSCRFALRRCMSPESSPRPRPPQLPLSCRHC